MQSEGDETEVKCEVINLTNSAIVVQVRSVLSATTDLAISSDRRGSQIEIPESRVLKIVLAQRGDSLWNGFLIGGAVGTGTMALLLGGLAQRTNEYVQEFLTDCHGSHIPASGILNFNLADLGLVFNSVFPCTRSE